MPINELDYIMQMPYEPPYDWPALRDFFARRCIQSNEIITEDSILKHFSIDEELIAVHMQYSPQEEHFTVRFAQNFACYENAIRDRVSLMLDLHIDPDVISGKLTAAGLNQSQFTPGLRIPRIACRFEAGVRAILGQQVTVTAAVSQLNKLHKALAPRPIQFPSAEDIAQSELDCIRLPQTRKQALRDFAQLMIETPGADLEQWLKIKGIGPWTVNYVNLRATSNNDVWLDTDLVIRQRVNLLAEREQMLAPDKCSPWRSYLTFALWNAAL
jgi:AraC family transcriptional regulator of adaptative response / DNA-3-methyladenine glycosylase II